MRRARRRSTGCCAPGLFVDLYQVVRHSLRASVESYSIKRLEPFYGFERQTPLTDANVALANLQANIELSDAPSIAEETKAVVRAYNEDDCRSTVVLRDWLEAHRAKLIADGTDVPRPQPGDGAPNEKITDWLIKINALIERLTADVPADPAERDEEQQARWILANIVDWHRREEKAVWWEYFRLAALSAEDLLEERAGLSGLVFAGAAGGTAKAPIHRYRFPPQETEIRGGEELCNLGGAKLGKVEAISFADNTVDIKKRQDTAGLHPQAAFAHSYVGGQVMAEALVRIGDYVADHGVRGDGPYQAARDLLLRESPRVGDEPLHRAGETTVEAAVRLCGHLAGGVLPIQGPPGAGKTFTGAQMICELVRRGKKVGITANSHKVIRNLIDATIKAADELGIDLQCCQKADEVEDPQHRLSFAKRNEDLFAALSGGAASVGGGTAWLWSRPDAFETVDVLFVDEAAQMSLANVLAVSQAAKTVVLIGDPQQLDQPMQGSHPEGTDVSALDHILGGERTISADKGLFLEETWRLHPAICAYTSELFYDGKLRSKPGLEKQVIKGSGPVSGSGLYLLPVAHSGNQNCSPEEAQAVGRSRAGDPRRQRDLGRSRREGEADHARRYRHHHALQRTGLRDSAMPAGRARGYGGQIPGPGSADRHLFDGDVESRGCPARDGVPLQPQPAQRRDLPRQMRIDPRRFTADLRSGVPHAAADSVGERLLPLSRDGKMHIVRLKISRFSGARLADVALGRRAERVAGGCWGQRRIEQDAVEGIRPMSADYRVVTPLARRR